MQKTKDINLNATIQIPKNLKVVKYKEYILVIAIDTACWIVLENEEQLCFFNLLNKHTIQNALDAFDGDIEDAKYVLTQIVARNFENTKITRTEANSIHFYLTNSCNLRCPHCFMYAGSSMKNELSTNEICSVLSCYKEHGGKEITFSGGEATVRHDFCEIVRYSHQVGLRINVFTNGVLWTDEIINEVSSLIYKVQVSIDGFSEEENSFVRGKGNFSKALSTIDKLLKKGVSVDLAITPWYDETLESKIQKYVDFARGMSKKYEEFNLEIIFTSAILDGRELKLSKEDKAKYLSIMDKIITLYNGENVKDLIFIDAHRRKMILDNCNFGCLAIAANGDVFMCSRIPDLKPIANIRKDSFDYIVKQSKLAQECSNINNLKPCKDCELKYICGGNCRIESFKDLVECTDFEHIDLNSLKPRECNEKIKNEFYDLMIRINEDLFE